MRPLVITGCGRSGTAWAAAVTTTCGWWCSHERQFPPAGTGRPLTFPDGYAESSASAAAYLDLIPDVYVVHLLRHPLDVVSSFAARGTFDRMSPGARFAATHVPEILDYPDGASRALAYWIGWNALVEPIADARWVTGSVVSTAIANTLTESGRPTLTDRADLALSLIPAANATAQRPSRLGWEAFAERLAQRAREQAAGYGLRP